MATLQNLENRYKALNEDFNLLTSKKHPASSAQLEAYQSKTGLGVTDDFQQFLTSFGEMIIEVNDTVWPKPEEFSVLPMWKFGYGFFVFGFSQHPDSPDWLTYEYNFSKEDTRGLGQLFFKRSGNLYRAYVLKGKIKIVYDEFSGDVEDFEGNIFDFIIAEIDKLEADYREYVKGK
jgi:hypothetical protein